MCPLLSSIRYSPLRLQYYTNWVLPFKFKSFCFQIISNCGVCLQLPLSVKLLSVVGLAVRGQQECWLSIFAVEQKKINKVENLLKAIYIWQLFSLFVFLSLPLSARDQTNLTSGLKVQLTHTQEFLWKGFFVCPFKYLKPETSMDLKTKANPEGQVQVTEKLSQK